MKDNPFISKGGLVLPGLKRITNTTSAPEYVYLTEDDIRAQTRPQEDRP